MPAPRSRSRRAIRCPTIAPSGISPSPSPPEDAIRATLASLAASLSEILEKRGEGARRLEAAFFRADGIVRRIAVGDRRARPRSQNRRAAVREKLAALIDPLDPGFGFDLIRLCASRAERAKAEAVDFDAGEQARREIRFLVDRLAARFGPQRILAFSRTTRTSPKPPGPRYRRNMRKRPSSPWEKVRRPKEAPRRPLRLFARPEPVGLLRSVPGSSAFHMRWRKTQRIVTRVEGPERIAMEWWRHNAPEPTRDYYRLEDEEGRRYWLYRNGVLDRDGLAPAMAGAWGVCVSTQFLPPPCGEVDVDFTSPLWGGSIISERSEEISGGGLHLHRPPTRKMLRIFRPPHKGEVGKCAHDRLRRARGDDEFLVPARSVSP